MVGIMKNKYGGMTVNERLVLSGLMAAFDEAINRKDFESATEFLEAVELDETNIRAIIAQVSERKR